MPNKSSSVLKFFIVAFFVIIFILSTSFFLGSKIFNNFVQTTSTTSITVATQTPTTTIYTKNKSLTREVFLDTKSGEGLLWFSNETISDVRASMKIWEEKTNHMVKFEEVRGESVADIVIKFSGSFNISSAGVKTTGEAYIYLGQIRGKIYILPSSMSCRNQVRAIHEIGHIIGLNHSSVYTSVMHPTESCVQNITNEDAAEAIRLISQFI